MSTLQSPVELTCTAMVDERMEMNAMTAMKSDACMLVVYLGWCVGRVDGQCKGGWIDSVVENERRDLLTKRLCSQSQACLGEEQLSLGGDAHSRGNV